MENLLFFAGAVAIGMIAGIILGFFIGRSFSSSGADGNARLLNARIDELTRSHKAALAEKDAVCDRIVADREALHREALARQERHSREMLEALQLRFNDTVAGMREEIASITAGNLRERQREFQATSAQTLDRLLTPLNTTIAEMKAAMADNTRCQHEFSGIFSANIDTMIRQSEAAKSSADRLADALSGNISVQGQWGETVLAELLSAHGLTKGIHFEPQSVPGEDSRMRPDILLHLDNDLDVFIDSKVSLSNFIAYLNADDNVKKADALKAHVESIERHVKKLAAKDYSSLVKPPRRSIGYVIMFVPNTTALLLATSARPDLWRSAMERNVYIADEQTLYAALRIVKMTWTHIAQAENQKKVFDLAGEMIDRVNTFMEKFSDIGRRIESLTKTYDECKAKIQENGHSIPQTCRKLINMGARGKRTKETALREPTPQEPTPQETTLPQE